MGAGGGAAEGDLWPEAAELSSGVGTVPPASPAAGAVSSRPGDGQSAGPAKPQPLCAFSTHQRVTSVSYFCTFILFYSLGEATLG